MPGLTLVCTPIGNLGDLSGRAEAVLREADVWLVEDTRVSGKLAAHLGVKKPMRVVNEHSADGTLGQLAEQAGEQTMVLLTDGGAPGISDPGARLVDLCLLGGVPVDAVPGPSAVTNALMLSGFYAQRYAFLGFLPRKPGPMRRELEPFAESPLTLVAFESPFRFRNLLAAAAETLGPRRYAICREMTKLHQQIYRATLPYAPSEAEVPSKGEFTVVFEGLRRSLSESENEWYDDRESA
jgi:16S rRNA (cytidine1402-2'-O)-methyltransferase